MTHATLGLVGVVTLLVVHEQHPTAHQRQHEQAREDASPKAVGGLGQAGVLGAEHGAAQAQVLEHLAQLHGHVVAGARQLLDAAP